ncbi:hypothetical protein [Emticicia fontis]
MQQEEIKKTAFRIKENWEQIAHLWEITKYYDNTGKVLEKQQPVKLELKAGESLFKRLQTLRTYLTPSYLNRIPERRRAIFEAEKRAELVHVQKLIDEQEDEFVQV